jgi:hypothetical protein
LLGELDFDPRSAAGPLRHRAGPAPATGGLAQYRRATEAFAKYGDDPFLAPGFERAPIEEHATVMIVGAGFEGLLSGARLWEAGVRDVRRSRVPVTSAGRGI